MARSSAIGLWLCLLAMVGGASIVVVGGPAIAVAATPSAAPASVDLIDVKFDRHHGTATVLVHVSGPGTLSLAGGQVVGRSVPTSGTGIAKLKVASKGGALATLVRSGAVEVRVTVEFVATEGARASVVRKITLLREHAAHAAVAGSL